MKGDSSHPRGPDKASPGHCRSGDVAVTNSLQSATGARRAVTRHHSLSSAVAQAVLGHVGQRGAHSLSRD